MYLKFQIFFFFFFLGGGYADNTQKAIKVYLFVVIFDYMRFYYLTKIIANEMLNGTETLHCALANLT